MPKCVKIFDKILHFPPSEIPLLAGARRGWDAAAAAARERHRPAGARDPRRAAPGHDGPAGGRDGSLRGGCKFCKNTRRSSSRFLHPRLEKKKSSSLWLNDIRTHHHLLNNHLFHHRRDTGWITITTSCRYSRSFSRYTLSFRCSHEVRCFFNESQSEESSSLFRLILRFSCSSAFSFVYIFYFHCYLFERNRH